MGRCFQGRIRQTPPSQSPSDDIDPLSALSLLRLTIYDQTPRLQCIPAGSYFATSSLTRPHTMQHSQHKPRNVPEHPDSNFSRGSKIGHTAVEASSPWPRSGSGAAQDHAPSWESLRATLGYDNVLLLTEKSFFVSRAAKAGHPPQDKELGAQRSNWV